MKEVDFAALDLGIDFGMRVFCVRMKDEGILGVYKSGMRVSRMG